MARPNFFTEGYQHVELPINETRPAGGNPNPFFPTAPRISSTLNTTILYQLGGVSSGSDTVQTGYGVVFLSYRTYHIIPIYTIVRILYLLGKGTIVYNIPTGRSTLWNRYPLSGVGIPLKS